MSLTKKIIYLSLGWVIGIATCLTVVEVSLRVIFDNDGWGKVKNINVLRNFNYNYKLNGLYPSSNEYVKYERNEFGLRDNCKDPSNISILTIGGSTTDQRYVPNESTWQYVLERYLTKEKDRKICVSNAGIDGHSTYGHIEAFKNWFPLIPGLQPKYVMLYVGINDANFQRPFEYNPGFDFNDNSDIKSLLKSLSIVRLLMPLIRYIRDGSANEGPAYAGHKPKAYDQSEYSISTLNHETKYKSKLNADIFRDRLIIILKEISKMNAEPICITQPHLLSIKKNGIDYGVPNIIGSNFSGLDHDHSIRELNKVIYDLCGDKVVDLYDQHYEAKYFYDGIHTTDIGSEYIGKKIFEIIKTRGILNGL